jgi:hypothetical protein
MVSVDGNFAGVSSQFVRPKAATAAKPPPAPCEHTLFCDETGNSGSRFFHPDQPIYAEGGWLIKNVDIPRANALIESLERQHGYTPQTKGTSLKSNPRGRRYIQQVFDELRHLAAPFLYLVEKRYFVCAKAVETYFDPNYNPMVDPGETWDPATRQQRADLLYAADDDVVRDFAEAYRSKDAAAIAAVGERWEEALENAGQIGLALQLRVSLREIEAHMRSEFELADPTIPPGFDSMNMPALAQVFQLVEQNLPPCELLHDECASFEEVYRYVYNMVSAAEPATLRMRDGRRHQFGFESLRALNFGNSEQIAMLRASDYLVAGCTEFARQSFAGKEPPQDLADIAYPGLGMLMVWALSHQIGQPVPQFGEVMASERFIGPVFKRLTAMTGPARRPDSSRRPPRPNASPA